MKRTFFVSIFIILLHAAVLAQDLDCRAQVQEFINSAREMCSALDSNQVCYGNTALEVQPRENVRIDFSEPGDMVDLSNLQSLASRPLNMDAETWGLALMSVRGDMVNNAIPMIAFGEVTIQNESTASSDFIPLDVTVSYPKGANVRATPSQDGTLVKSLYAGDTVKAVGRLEDGSWIRLLDGWVSVDLIRSQADLSLLKVLEPDAEVTDDIYGAMQIFRFRSGYEDSTCAGAPDSGILVQTPDGVKNALLIVNGAPLTFTGTLYLQTTVEGKTVVSQLEGELIYDEGNKKLETGERMAYGYQGETIVYLPSEDYNYARTRYLPFQLLPREFELPFSLGGVIFPFTPGTGFLTTIAPDAQCTAAWSVDVNLRSGPGTDYPIRRGIPGGFYGRIDARAVGTDGQVWWRLAEGIWILANNTASGGNCADLPLIDAPPIPANS